MKGFSGPIGSGKSQALCHEAIRLTYLNPGRPGLIGAPTYPMLRDATQQALFEILNSNRIPFDYSKAEVAKTIFTGLLCPLSRWGWPGGLPFRNELYS